MGACPDEGVFVSLIERRLDDAQRTALEGHLDRCPECVALVAALGEPPPTEGPTLPEAGLAFALEPGEHLGRYEITGIVGRGGTGVVYAALDPKLDRPVAIKTLTGRRISATARATFLQREARALAKLAHPSVVPVFDVGIEDGTVYVVMELVQGQTLHAWIELAKPSVKEIVEAYRKVADGLAAAHAAGLVHRDVKPTNLMRATDGSIRVLDFGFAAAVTRADTPPMSGPGRSGASGSSNPGSLVVGTVGYMAPEQWRNEPDPHSDQFSFCASLYESIIGRRPFPTRGIPTGEPAGERPAGVPRKLDAVVRRGLALKAGDRWPSMATLSAELGRAIRSRPILPWIAGAAVALGGIVLMLPQEDACASGAHSLDAVWSPARAEVAGAFNASSGGFGDETFRRVEPAIDAYAERWRGAFVAVCDEAPVAADRSIACLGRLRSEFEAQLAVLGAPRREVVARAVELVAGLDEPTTCETAAREGDEAAALDTDLRVRLAELRARLRAGEAAELLQPASDLALRTRDAPANVRALTQQVIGEIRYAAGLKEGSIPNYEAAYFAAVDAELPEARARAAADLLFVYAVDLSDPQQGARWAGHARAALDDAPDNPRQRAVLENALGAAAVVTADYDTALDHFQASADAWQGLGNDLGRVRSVGSRVNAARVHFSLGDYATAQAQFQEAVLDVRGTLGDAHPMLVVPLINRAAALRELGRSDEALALIDEAIAVADKTLGPDHPEMALAISNRCQALYNMTPPRVDEAVQSCRRALEIRERAIGPNNPEVAATLTSLGTAYRLWGRYEEAVGALERARLVFAERLGEENPAIGPVLFELAETHVGAGDIAAGLSLFRQVRTLWMTAYGADHPLTQRAEKRVAALELRDASGRGTKEGRPERGER